MYYGHWFCAFKFDSSEWFGFIYRIIDLDNGKQYLGKKQFNNYTTKAVKGKTRRKKIVKTSNWESYTSSSNHINDAIIERGKDRFVFIIESLHKTKGSLYYAEVEAQITEDVLRIKKEDGTRAYYNGVVSGVKFLPPIPTAEEALHNVKNLSRGPKKKYQDLVKASLLAMTETVSGNT